MSTETTQTKDAVRILGIDPGLNITGYGVVTVSGDSVSVVEAGVIRSKRTDDLGTRLSSIHEGITDVISTCLLYTSPSPRDRTRSRMPSSA